jgi:protease I
MTSGVLQGVRVAILVSNGFEEAELLDSKRALDYAGAATFVIAPSSDRIFGSNEGRGEKQVSVDIPLETARPEDFHALFLPGGTANADNLAVNGKARDFVKHFMLSRKPVAAIAEGPALLFNVTALSGRKVTASAPLQQAIEEAGAHYIDQDVVCDANLITARKLEDISSFNREMIRAFSELREHSQDMRKTA